MGPGRRGGARHASHPVAEESSVALNPAQDPGPAPPAARDLRPDAGAGRRGAQDRYDGLARRAAPPLTAVPDPAMDALARRYPRQCLAVWQARDQLAADDRWALMEEAVDLHIARAAWSRRQLLEVIADFWSNHLNVTCPSSDVWDPGTSTPATSSASTPSARSPTCSWPRPGTRRCSPTSTTPPAPRRRPNENYGRELLELHTVGVDGGYTEEDVRASALHPDRPVGRTPTRASTSTSRSATTWGP